MARLSGNDIASFQGDINYDVFKNNSHFVIMKATEGVGFIDPKFSRNQSESRRVGMLRGYYHFARPDLGNTPEAEADYFLSKVGQLQEGEVMALDYECANQKQADVDWCKKWLDRVFSKTGVRPLIYMSESVVTRYDWSSVVAGSYGLWIAKYLNNPTPDASYNTGKWSFAAMYQWTSGQQVPGIPVQRVDGDVFYGDFDTFKKYGYKPAPPPPPPTDWQKKYNDEVAAHNETKKQFQDYKNGEQQRIDQATKPLQEKIDNAKKALG